jgi:hypothetical protein
MGCRAVLHGGCPVWSCVVLCGPVGPETCRVVAACCIRCPRDHQRLAVDASDVPVTKAGRESTVPILRSPAAARHPLVGGALREPHPSFVQSAQVAATRLDRARGKALRDRRARRGIGRRDHRVVRGQAPLRAVFVGGHREVALQVALARLRLASVFETDEVVFVYRLFRLDEPAADRQRLAPPIGAVVES